MNFMFYGDPVSQIGGKFNQDIGNWDVSKVTSMKSMFSNSNFNQNLSNWNVFNVIECDSFSSGNDNWTLPKPNFTNCNPN
jgi:surface protein